MEVRMQQPTSRGMPLGSSSKVLISREHWKPMKFSQNQLRALFERRSFLLISLWLMTAPLALRLGLLHSLHWCLEGACEFSSPASVLGNMEIAVTLIPCFLTWMNLSVSFGTFCSVVIFRQNLYLHDHVMCYSWAQSHQLPFGDQQFYCFINLKPCSSFLVLGNFLCLSKLRTIFSPCLFRCTCIVICSTFCLHFASTVVLTLLFPLYFVQASVGSQCWGLSSSSMPERGSRWDVTRPQAHLRPRAAEGGVFRGLHRRWVSQRNTISEPCTGRLGREIAPRIPVPPDCRARVQAGSPDRGRRVPDHRMWRHLGRDVKPARREHRPEGATASRQPRTVCEGASDGSTEAQHLWQPHSHCGLLLLGEPGQSVGFRPGPACGAAEGPDAEVLQPVDGGVVQSEELVE